MSSQIFAIKALIIFLLLLIYIVVGTIVEKKKPRVGHEAGIVILAGVVISYSVKAAE